MLVLLVAALTADPCKGGIEVRREYEAGELRRIVCRKIEDIKDADIGHLPAPQQAVFKARIEMPAAFKSSDKAYFPVREGARALIQELSPMIVAGKGEISMLKVAEILLLTKTLESDQLANLEPRMITLDGEFGKGEGNPVVGRMETPEGMIKAKIGRKVSARVRLIRGGGFVMTEIKGLEVSPLPLVWVNVTELYVNEDRLRIKAFKEYDIYFSPQEKQ